MYDTDLKRKWDNKAVMDFHEDKGEKRGLLKGEKRGLLKGEKRGLLKGEKRGLKKGRKEEQKEIICNMIEESGFDDSRIASLTGVNIKRVKEIRAEMKKKDID